MRYPLLGSVTVEDAVLHCQYHVGKRYLSTRVKGVSTDILASQFMGGDSVADVAQWMGLGMFDVEDALRWELRPRRTRVRMVERAIRRHKPRERKVKHGD